MPPRTTTSPAAVAALAFAAGIALSAHLETWAWCVGATVVCLAGAEAARRLPGGSIATGIALCALLCSGGVRMAIFRDATGPVADDGRLSVWSGTVVEPPVRTYGGVRFVLELDRPGPGTRLLVAGPLDDALEHCDDVQITGRIDALPGPRNPGDFDYGAFLSRRRIVARLFFDRGAVTVLGRRRSGIDCRTAPIRESVRARLTAYVRNDDARGVLQALLLGDRRYIPVDVRDQFSRMGLLHLLAVSGLHVMIVGMVFYRLLGPLLTRGRLAWSTVERVRAAATMGLLLLFMVLTGCAPSVVRAVVMAVVFLGSSMLQRPLRPINGLGVAVLILLASRPTHLFEAGFQLSVSAVGSILLVIPVLQSRIESFPHPIARHVFTSLAVTGAATIGTLPIALHHFGQFGAAGLLLNLPAIPLTTAVLGAGVATVMSGAVSPHVAEVFGTSADVLAQALLWLTRVADEHLYWSVFHARLDDPMVLAAMTFGLVSLAMWPYRACRRYGLLLTTVVIAITPCLRLFDGRHAPGPNVIFLDVGQGDAVLVVAGGGNGILIDAGPRSRAYDAGSAVVVPQLRYHGVRRLSTVVVTHPDSDHLGGLSAVLRAVPVGRVVRPSFEGTSALYEETEDLLDHLGVPRRTVHAGDTLQLPGGLRGYVLHPPYAYPAMEANAHSLVLLLQHGTASIMFEGDAPAMAELEIVRRFGPLLSSNLLKVAHHGSRTSSTGAMLAAVGGTPGTGAIISVGTDNRFGLPDEDVLARLRRHHYRVFETGKQGAVWFRSDGRRFLPVRWRDTLYETSQ